MGSTACLGTCTHVARKKSCASNEGDVRKNEDSITSPRVPIITALLNLFVVLSPPSSRPSPQVALIAMQFDLPPLRIALYFTLVRYRGLMVLFVYDRCYSVPLFVGSFWLVSGEVVLYHPSAERRSSERWKQLLWLVLLVPQIINHRPSLQSDSIVVELLFTTILTVPWSIFM